MISESKTGSSDDLKSKGKVVEHQFYRPLPDIVTIKKSEIEGLGLYAEEDLEPWTFIGLTHIKDERFQDGYLRTPLGGFYNENRDAPNIKSIFTDEIPPYVPKQVLDMDRIPVSKEAKFRFMVTKKAVKKGEELVARYNLYNCDESPATSPKGQ